MKKVVAWVFRKAYRSELKKIERLIRADGHLMKNMPFTEQLATGASIDARLDLLDRLDLLEP